MVITILEGKVSIDKISLLKANYRKILKNKPRSIIKTYLILDTKNQNICKLITVWKSKKELDEMRKQGTPAGVLLFREVGAEPSLSIYEVIGQS